MTVGRTLIRVHGPQPSAAEVRVCAELVRMALTEAGYPPRIIGYRDDGEVAVELLPAEVVTRAQTLACRKLGWDFELVPAGGEG